MARSITYTHEDDKGILHEFDVEFTVMSNRDGNLEQPPEEGYIEITSVKENGKEVSLNGTLIKKIEKYIYDQNEGSDLYENHEN